MTRDDTDRLKVLEQLESGNLDFDQALSELQAATGEEQAPTREEQAPTGKEQVPTQPATQRWHLWWLIPFYFGALATGLGIVLAFQGGWWWLLAAPLILLGLGLAILALASTRSPWLHVRIHNSGRVWPKTIGISFPVPFRFAAWAIRTFGPLIPNLDEQAVAEMLIAFELGRKMDEPMNVEVNDPDSATRIEIFLG